MISNSNTKRELNFSDRIRTIQHVRDDLSPQRSLREEEEEEGPFIDSVISVWKGPARQSNSQFTVFKFHWEIPALSCNLIFNGIKFSTELPVLLIDCLLRHSAMAKGVFFSLKYLIWELSMVSIYENISSIDMFVLKPLTMN